MVQVTCPDAARWEALLVDAAPDVADLEAHLSTCPRCRETLDELAVGSSGWLRDAGRLAVDADRDPQLTRTLNRLRTALAEDDPVGSAIPLDFLTPSDQPGILGTLRRYQVLAVLGRGAMGIVLKALDPDLLRPVAIKVMAPHLAPSGTARERFKREARAAAAVSHDHIVTVHAVEEGNGLPYLVMEYVSGISLQARIDRDGPLPPRDIARIGYQAACGLAAAHEQGLVHRDVKPANILLENGVERVKITDFGLAQAADDARLTQSGVAAGTPLYMSPEQARGEAVDARSDLFSLGSVLYTLATGFPPFRAGTAMGVLHRITNDPPRPIRDTIPDFPSNLETIIMQLLTRDPARRFPSAAQVADRLTEFLAAAPERPKVRRDWRLAAALALAATLLIAGVLLTFRTPYGTLTVEVNDPAAKVALDGNELTITGAGLHELRIKAGTYRVTAAKDGKPIPVQPDVVTVTRDGKVIVRVTANPAADPPALVAGPGEPRKPIDPLPFAEPSVAPVRSAAFETLLKKTSADHGAVIARLKKTAPGKILQTVTYPIDVPKAMAGLTGAAADRASRLLSLASHYEILAPKAVAEIGLWEKRKIKAVEAGHRFQAGLISKLENETATAELRDSERVLTTYVDTLGGIVADLQGLAAEFEAADSPEGQFKQVMAEYDALVIRLARHPIGRLMTTIERKWNDGMLEGRDEIPGTELPKAIRLLRLRDEIQTQAEKAESVQQAIHGHRATIATFTSQKAESSVLAPWEEMLRREQTALTVHTETIRGLVADLTKLTSEILPATVQLKNEAGRPKGK